MSIQYLSVRFNMISCYSCQLEEFLIRFFSQQLLRLSSRLLRRDLNLKKPFHQQKPWRKEVIGQIKSSPVYFSNEYPRMKSFSSRLYQRYLRYLCIDILRSFTISRVQHLSTCANERSYSSKLLSIYNLLRCIWLDYWCLCRFCSILCC